MCVYVLCVYVCMYMCRCVCMFVYLCVCVSICVHVCVCLKCLLVVGCVYMYVLCVCAFVRACECVCVCVCVCKFVHMFIVCVCVHVCRCVWTCIGVCSCMIYHRVPFFEGYKFREWMKKGSSKKLFSQIYIGDAHVVRSLFSHKSIIFFSISALHYSTCHHSCLFVSSTH